MATLSSNPGSPLSAYAAEPKAAPPGPKPKAGAPASPWSNIVRPGVSRRMVAPTPQGERPSAQDFPAPSGGAPMPGLDELASLPATADETRIPGKVGALPQIVEARRLWTLLHNRGVR